MNKTALITGANGVLGNLAAKTLAARGFNLALFGRDLGKLSALAGSLPPETTYTSAADLTDPASLQTAAQEVDEKFGGVYALLHLVGGWTGGKTIPATSTDEFASMLNQHAWTTYFLLKAFTPLLIKQPASRIVVVSHPVAEQPAPKSVLYAAAKSAQQTLVLGLAEEYKNRGLTANLIQVKSIAAEGKGSSPEEIVAAMEYLLSPQADKISGMRIPLYGE